MGRSIHTTRRDLMEMEKQNYSSQEEKVRRKEILIHNLRRKRIIKDQIKRKRRENVFPSVTAQSGDVPIHILDEGPAIHYPAGPEDFRAVMDRLPGGMMERISEIHLSLGIKIQKEVLREYSWSPGPDPYCKRLSTEILPGIYQGICLGVYYPQPRKINVFAYVYQDAGKDREINELYLKLKMLSTFVHEAAHHQDAIQRTGRGRWLMDDREKDEMYAETFQHNLTQKCVVPYLTERYPKEVAKWTKWVKHYGGIEISLAKLAGDPQTTCKGGFTHFFFAFDSAFETLAEAVSKKQALPETRLLFAKELCYCGEYEKALHLVNRLLRKEPRWYEALVRKAELLTDLKQYEESLALVQRLLRKNREDLEVLWILRTIYFNTKNWRKLLRIAIRIFELHDPYKKLDHISALYWRAIARWKMHGHQAAQEDIEAIEAMGRMGKWRIRRIKEICRGRIR